MRALLLLSAGLAGAPLALAQSLWTVEALDIRPAGDDFAPVLVDSNLVISSIREQPRPLSYTTYGTDKPLADLYEVQLRDGKRGRATLLGSGLNSSWNDGPASFSPGGDTICITRNIPAKGRKHASDRLGLFFSVKQDGRWSVPAPFAHNNEGWSVMHGSFSPDGKTLFFASDKPGGSGGTDLYLCHREGDGWGAPQNLGPGVNSAANELFPGLDAFGELHFSSDRDGGQGQLDLYASLMEGPRFTTPAALPEPLNSAANDFGWTSYGDGVSGFFSSDREGTGRIFRFHKQPVPFQDCMEQKPTELCYLFQDEGSLVTDTLPLRYEWDFGDGQRQRGLEAEHCYAGPGTYTVKLNIVDTLSESVFFNETTYELEALADEQAVIGTSAGAAAGLPVIFDAGQSNLPGFQVQHIHWDLGDGTVVQDLRPTHVYASPGTYRVRMDLIGGPDGRGGFGHHCVYRDLVLTESPATPAPAVATRLAGKAQADEFAFRYLELPNDYVTAASKETTDVFFSVQLISSTERIGLDDVRFLNVRKHYTITERFIPKQRLYTYSIGNSTSPAGLYDAFAFARKNGFGESVVERTPQDKPLSIEKAEELTLSELDNRVISVSRVLFETGKSSFSPSFLEALEHVLRVAEKYPQLELVIEAHTDDVGSGERNMALSNERARSVMEYFILEGIDASRLRPIGYGKSRPVADNGTEEGRALNRRVDFRLNVTDNQPLAHP